MWNASLRESTQRRLIDYLFKAKIISILVVLTLLVIFHYFRFLGLQTIPIILAMLLETLVFVLYFLLRRTKPEWVLTYNVVSLYLDVLAVTFVLHYFGGIYSMIWAADYVFFIGLASVFLSRRGRLSYALFSALAYSFLCYLEHQGVIPRHNPFHIPESGRLDLFCWLSTMSLVVLMAFISNNFMEMLSRIQRFADLGRLSTELAHEIRTPLQVIDGATRAADFPEKSRQEIKAQTERVGRFVKEMMALGREEKQNRAKARLQDLVDYAVRLVFKATPGQKGVELELKYADEALWVLADIDQVTKAISNIVRNAIEAMNGKGRLTITVSRYGFEWVQAEIRDTGIGIEKSEAHRIFEPFYTTKAGMRGVGLGLAIAKKFVEANGGNIEVESVAGQGATFLVRLPLYQEG